MGEYRNSWISKPYFGIPLHPPSFTRCAHQLPDGPYLDAAYSSRRNLRGDLDGLIKIGGINQIKTCQTLLCLRERTIGDRGLSIANAHSLSSAHGLKSLRGEACSVLAEGLIISHAVIVSHGSDFFLFAVNEAYEFQLHISFEQASKLPSSNRKLQ